MNVAAMNAIQHLIFHFNEVVKHCNVSCACGILNLNLFNRAIALQAPSELYSIIKVKLRKHISYFDSVTIFQSVSNCSRM